jgi:hypothetical protein
LFVDLPDPCFFAEQVSFERASERSERKRKWLEVKARYLVVNSK